MRTKGSRRVSESLQAQRSTFSTFYFVKGNPYLRHVCLVGDLAPFVCYTSPPSPGEVRFGLYSYTVYCLFLIVIFASKRKNTIVIFDLHADCHFEKRIVGRLRAHATQWSRIEGYQAMCVVECVRHEKEWAVLVYRFLKPYFFLS